MKELSDEDGYVYCGISRCMYELKEVGCVAFQNLVKDLAVFGYEPMLYIPGLWHHKTRRKTFTLEVDDFGTKNVSQYDYDHLLDALITNYTITADTTGSHYYRLRIVWNYNKQYVDISIPGYMVKALHKFQHLAPKKTAICTICMDSPNVWTKSTV